MKARGASIWLVRLLIAISIGPILLWTAVSRIIGEVSSIPWYVWWDWCGEVEYAVHMWRTGKIPDGRGMGGD